jgi:hypothetical protein
MHFDSNRAWNEGVALVSANREVLLAVAGVFFLLPGLASVLFFSDFQNQLMTNLGNRGATERLIEGMALPLLGFAVVSFFAQAVGNLAMLDLITNRARPTVAEAIGNGIRAMPTVIGAALLFFAGYMAAALVLGVIAGGLGAATGLKAFVALVVVLFIIGMVYVLVKLSLILPVIAVEKIRNPAAALQRAWRLTRGNSARLFLFYLLLMIAYFVILMIVSMVAMGLAGLIAGQGMVSLLIGGLVSGIAGAVASALLVAVLAAIHRQLAGPGASAIGETFD